MIKNLKELIDHYGHKDNRIEIITSDRKMYNIINDGLEKKIIDINFIKNNLDYISIHWLQLNRLLVEVEGFSDIYTKQYINEVGGIVDSNKVFEILTEYFSDEKFIRCCDYLLEKHLIAILIAYDIKDKTKEYVISKYKDNKKIMGLL